MILSFGSKDVFLLKIIVFLPCHRVVDES